MSTASIQDEDNLFTYSQCTLWYEKSWIWLISCRIVTLRQHAQEYSKYAETTYTQARSARLSKIRRFTPPREKFMGFRIGDEMADISDHGLGELAQTVGLTRWGGFCPNEKGIEAEYTAVVEKQLEQAVSRHAMLKTFGVWNQEYPTSVQFIPVAIAGGEHKIFRITRITSAKSYIISLMSRVHTWVWTLQLLQQAMQSSWCHWKLLLSREVRQGWWSQSSHQQADRQVICRIKMIWVNHTVLDDMISSSFHLATFTPHLLFAFCVLMLSEKASS